MGDQVDTAPAVVPLATRVSPPATAVDALPVRRKRGRPRDPQADGRILAAASSLILLRGFDAMTVDEVASNAGVGKATVYRRWARKEDLALAAMEQLYRDEMPVPDTGSLRQDLTEAFRSTLVFANSPAGADYLRTLVKESMRDDRMASLYREASQRAETSAMQIFERGVLRGEVRSDVPLPAAVRMLMGLIVVATVMRTEPPAVDEVDELVELVMRGVATQA